MSTSTGYRGRYRPEEDRLLLELYNRETLRSIAARLGRSPKSVSQRSRWLARRAALPATRHYRRPWTADEDDFLAENWGHLRDETCAVSLNRSVRACTLRAQGAGLSRKMAFWSCSQVAELMGVSRATVVGWIRADLLRARRSHVRCGQGSLVWHIADQAIEDFLRGHPEAYHAARVERGTWYRQLAEKVARKHPWVFSTEAARELGVSASTLQSYLRAGRLEGRQLRPRGNWRIPRAALEQFKGRRQEGDSAPLAGVL